MTSNTGIYNTGDRNTGYWNTGYWNTGNRNTGDSNTGNWNTGDFNVGNSNTGYGNTGDWNTGNRNTGYWNTGNRNTGYCNTITPEDVLIFNKPAKYKDWADAKKPRWMYAQLTEWIDEDEMSDKEKEAYPTYVTTGGYLKCHPSLKHAYIEAWGKADEEDRARTFKLPNFDVDVFQEIFGFDPRGNKKKIVIDDKEILISEESFNELKNQLIGD